MRKLIVCNIISLDGFFSGPGGNVMVMPSGRLRLLDTRAFDGSSLLLARYAVDR